jgi:hypothetical protein
MANTIPPIVEGELSEHTFTALWKYTKYILWFHVLGVLSETETS